MATRRVLAVVVVVAVCAAAIHLRPIGRPPADEATMAVSRAVAALERGAIDVRLIDADGQIVASARLAPDGSASLAVDGIEATQQADELQLQVGAVNGVPAFDRAALIGAATRGRPPARLVHGRFEIDLADGARLEITPG